MPEVPELCTVRELAGVFKVSTGRAYELCREGVIPGVVRLGRQIRIDRAKLQEFLANGGQGLIREH